MDLDLISELPPLPPAAEASSGFPLDERLSKTAKENLRCSLD